MRPESKEAVIDFLRAVQSLKNIPYQEICSVQVPMLIYRYSKESDSVSLKVDPVKSISMGEQFQLYSQAVHAREVNIQEANGRFIKRKVVSLTWKERIKFSSIQECDYLKILQKLFPQINSDPDDWSFISFQVDTLVFGHWWTSELDSLYGDLMVVCKSKKQIYFIDLKTASQDRTEKSYYRGSVSKCSSDQFGRILPTFLPEEYQDYQCIFMYLMTSLDGTYWTWLSVSALHRVMQKNPDLWIVKENSRGQIESISIWGHNFEKVFTQLVRGIDYIDYDLAEAKRS